MIDELVRHGAGSTSVIKRHAADLAALVVVIGLCLVFYYPETSSLESRYMYYPDCFERAATQVNPSYTGRRFRTAAEDMRPLMTLLARPALAVFRSDPAAAVTSVHLGLALVAGVLTYLANRYYFAPFLAFYLTALLLFDRCLMPVARGLGMMGALLLAPLAFMFLAGLARTQDRSLPRGRRVLSVLLMGGCGGGILLLGGHETMYALVSAVGFVGVCGVIWIVQSIRARGPVSGPTASTLVGFAAAACVAVALAAVLCLGIPAEQRKGGLWSVVLQQHYQQGAAYDIEHELDSAAPRLQQWKATFWDGHYPSEYGAWHANTFLVPGPGFNGIIPFVVVPGLLVGLWWWGRGVVDLVRPQPVNTAARSQRYFLILNTALLGVFVSVAAISGDPKPTRYSPCIYAVFALSAVGYRRLYVAIRNHAGEWGRSVTQVAGRRQLLLSRGVPLVLVFTVALLLGFRVHKNYQDLVRYFSYYRFEITTYGLPPLLKQALKEHADQQVYFVARRWLGPDIGLLLGYSEPVNLTFMRRAVFDRPNVQRIVPDEAIIFLREDLGGESTWRCARAAEFKKK
ncbi:MAG: hypothetical protein KKB50_07440 [Planctomycetes bacterium]|nr:hypothetical protein [Planctomycetota bacterium]